MDHLGRFASLGPLVRLGLLRKRETGSEFQRYNGYVPTTKGEELMVHIPEKELILVRPGCAVALFSALKKDPAPEAAFKETYAEPTAPQFLAAEEQRERAGHDVWRVQRADQLRALLLEGYMEVQAFTTHTGVGEGALLRHGLCIPRDDRAHDRSLAMELSAEGKKYLHIADPWALLLVKPGMELPLFERCEPTKAQYWCTLP
jgi:hypothetical protein